MEYSVLYTKSYVVKVEANSFDEAKAKWEDMDLDFMQENHTTLDSIELRDDSGNLSVQFYDY